MPLPLTLDRGSATPLGTQVGDRIRELVVRGALTRGERLPSSRALAADLGVARGVVEQAYGQLVAEGWLEGRRGAGTVVAASGAARPRAPRPRPDSPAPELVRLDAGTPWIDPRHRDLWRRAWREVAAAEPPLGYDDPRGVPALREAVAERLGRVRGLVVEADDVRITSGTTDGLRHLLTALGPGDIGIEDPGYRSAVVVARAAGRGVRDLPALAPIDDLTGCAAMYLTPAHQHPLGPAMPAAERLRLLGVAERDGVHLIEDDYDSEFRYDVAPIPALTSLAPQRCAYLGTASKSVAPSLRLGWMVAPDELRPALDRHRARSHEVAAWPVQRAMLALLRDGYVDRVVRSARRVYAARAARVVEALAPRIEHDAVAGMYACLELDEATAQRAHDAARRAGFDVPLLADYARGGPRHGLVVGFGGCTDEQLDRALEVLRTALG